MALIQCMNCGKEVSDRAKVCPGCGKLLIAIEAEQEGNTAGNVVCEDCGMTFEFGVDSCPRCGCPAPATGEIVDQVPQKTEAISAIPQAKRTKKKYVIIAVIAVIFVALIGFISGSIIHKQRAEQAAHNAVQTYKANFQTACDTMISGLADAETACNLIKSVWRNSIYEEYDDKTDKYTRPDGYFLEDFNDALYNLFSDSTFAYTIYAIAGNQETVVSLMKELKDPPDEFEEAYDAIKDFYEAYLELTSLAIDPQGSLNTFSDDFTEAQANALKYYNAMRIYIPD